MGPTYRQRLRIEGLALVACGAVDAAILLRADEQTRRWPLNTAAQLAVVVVLLAALLPRSVRSDMADSIRAVKGQTLTGDPTPLWQLPLILAALTLSFVKGIPATGLPGSELAGWDAGLRIAGGCMLVGLAQAVVADRIVAADEQRQGRTYYRVAAAPFVTALVHRDTAEPEGGQE
ncbi:MAG: hypothetical protein ACR2NA_13970 [Solirubrobacterales bacterium]